MDGRNPGRDAKKRSSADTDKQEDPIQQLSEISINNRVIYLTTKHRGTKNPEVKETIEPPLSLNCCPAFSAQREKLRIEKRQQSKETAEKSIIGTTCYVTQNIHETFKNILDKSHLKSK